MIEMGTLPEINNVPPFAESKVQMESMLGPVKVMCPLPLISVMFARSALSSAVVPVTAK